MLKKLVLVLSCACAMNTCLANNIADNVEANAEAAAAYNCLYDAQGRVIYGTVNSFAQISSDILAEV